MRNERLSFSATDRTLSFGKCKWKTLLLFLFLAPVYSYAQWTWRHPLPQGNDLASLWFLNADTGFLVGRAGTIMKTTDGGMTWSTINLLNSPGPNPTYFKDVHFPDILHGYAVDSYDANVFKTSDGGQSWTCVLLENDFLNSIHFADSLHGFVVGDYGQAFRTSDGGATWSHMLPGYNVSFTSVFFTGLQTGYVAGRNGLILHTADGGYTWSQQPSGTNADLACITFINPLVGFAVGDSGVVLKTTDAGNTWTLYQDQVSSSFISVSAMNPDSLLLLGRHHDTSFVCQSFNGGITLTDIHVSTQYPNYLNRLFCTPDGIGYSDKLY